MKRKIAVIPGDGIGQEVTAAALQIMKHLNQKHELNLEFHEKDWGAEKWLKEGVGLPKGALEDLREHYSAIYLGALGDPRIPDMAHGREIILGLRMGLDLYLNLRPIRLLHPSQTPLKGAPQVDMVIFRENTEDIYAGLGGILKKNTPEEVALDESVHTYKGVQRIIEQAFLFAQKHRRARVTLVDKSNAIRFGGSLWQRVFKEIAAQFSSIEAKHLYVDAAAMEMILHPEKLDVVVTSNLFGDILSDVGAGLVGGLGLLPSANLHPGKIGLFEPVHGSAPDIAGKGIANPMAAILTGGMMLEYVGHKELGLSLEKAVKFCLEERYVTPDLGGQYKTEDVVNCIINKIDMF